MDERSKLIGKRSPLELVHLCARSVSGNSKQGSGFVGTSLGHIVTCRHVLTIDGKPADSIELIGSDQPRNLVISNENEGADLTLLVPEGTQHERSQLLFDYSSPEVGDTVVAYGYAASEYYSEPWRQPMSVVAFREDPMRIGLQGGASQGDSGGPIFDALERLVGVFQATDPKRPGHAMATPAEDVSALIGSFAQPTNSRHPLLKFPIGPRVSREHLTPELTLDVAEQFPSAVRAAEPIRQANALFKQTDPTLPTLSFAYLPNWNDGPYNFWAIVFNESCLMGPRFLAALLKSIDVYNLKPESHQTIDQVLMSLR